MDWNHPEYEKVKAQVPEIAPGNPKIRAVFTLVAELDMSATAATGKALDEVVEAACPENGFTPRVVKSENSGYVVFRDVLYVEEHVMGEKDFVAVPATQAHKDKYADSWERFLALQRIGLHPVTAIHQITPAAVETFRGLGIGSMEKLAAHDGPLPEQFERHRTFARHYLAVVHGKPRVKLVDGALVQVN